MKPHEILQQATYRALEGDLQPGERIPQAIFRIIGEEMHLDNFSTEDFRELREAVLTQEKSEPERAKIIATGLRRLRSQAYGMHEALSGKDMQASRQEGEELTEKIVNGVVNFAETYPAAPPLESNEEFGAAFKTAFKPDDTPEAKLRSAYVASELLTPFLAHRLSETNWSSRELAAEGIKRLGGDIKILSSVYRSVAPAIEHGFEADESKHKEIAESLFTVGPLFAKAGQAVAGMANAAADRSQAEFMSNIGRALQEGIAQPTAQDIDRMKASLPTDVVYEKVLSSASIAHVLKVDIAEGDALAVKIKRANIEKSIADNVRAYQILVDVAKAFVDEHAGDGLFTARLDIITKALPFALEVLESDIKKELDLESEAQAQIQAGKDFVRFPGVVVPRVDQQRSDSEHLFMTIEPATRIEELPANPRLLTNLMVVGLQMWHTRAWHADLHPGNIKGRENGDVVIYDWAKPISLSPKFMGNFIRFMRSIHSQKPEKVARAYSAIQSGEYTQATQEDIATTAQDVFAAQPKDRKANLPFQQFLMTMGIRHQSTLDFNYATFMRSAGAFRGVIKSEVTKPGYGGKTKRTLALVKAGASAFREVYLTRK